jgi:alpha-mannosidase
VRRRAPGLLKAVNARLRSGQWQATGGLYVESDSNLVCGEGLARSFILGQAAFKQLTGRASRVLWLPDLFGFSACLPQLMRLSGVDYFFTTKTTWNKVNRFPHSSFLWRGPGNHAVLGHVTQGVQFNNTVAVEQLRTASHQNQQADLHDEFLLPTGWGDGGGGPSEEMCERARRLASMRGLPAVHWDQPEAFFAPPGSPAGAVAHARRGDLPRAPPRHLHDPKPRKNALPRTRARTSAARSRACRHLPRTRCGTGARLAPNGLRAIP